MTETVPKPPAVGPSIDLTVNPVMGRFFELSPDLLCVAGRDGTFRHLNPAWEVLLGHPLADFVYHLMIYRMKPGFSTGLDGLDLGALNIPSEADYVAAYCRRTGRPGIDRLDFYMAFSLFKLAAIIHGIKGRLIRGTASSPQAAEAVAQLDDIAARALAQTRT